MLRKKYGKYFYLGVTLLSVVIASVVFYLVFSNLGGFLRVLGSILHVCSFLLFGAVFAYLMNPLMSKVEKPLRKLLDRTRLTERVKKILCRAVGIVIALLVLLATIFAIIMLVVPQLIETLKDLLAPEKITGYYNQITGWFDSVTRDSSFGSIIREYGFKLLDNVQAWLTANVFNNIINYLQGFLSGIYNIVYSFILGFVVAIYFLAAKEKFQAQSKKLTVAIFKPKHADRVLELARRTNNIFGGYIVGKLLEALINGILAYIGLLIIGAPYPLLIAAIIGVGIIIPVFGPIIAAVVGGILVLLIDPSKTLWYLLVVVLLMQLDGNLIGPKILGDRLGLSTFWVIFAVAIFGGLFAIPGMIFGLPLFAVLYSVIRDWIERSLKKKGHPLDTDVYYSILCVSDLAQYKKDFGESTVFFSADSFDAEYDPEDDYEYFDPDEG